MAVDLSKPSKMNSDEKNGLSEKEVNNDLVEDQDEEDDDSEKIEQAVQEAADAFNKKYKISSQKVPKKDLGKKR